MQRERGRMLMVMTSFHHQNLIKMQSDLYQTVVHLCGCSALEASANFNYTPSQLNTLHKINIHACVCACIHISGHGLKFYTRRGGCKTTTAAPAKTTTPDQERPARRQQQSRQCALFLLVHFAAPTLWCAHTRMQIAEEPRCAAPRWWWWWCLLVWITQRVCAASQLACRSSSYANCKQREKQQKQTHTMTRDHHYCNCFLYEQARPRSLCLLLFRFSCLA